MKFKQPLFFLHIEVICLCEKLMNLFLLKEEDSKKFDLITKWLIAS